jgi:hypothetical protein
MSYIIFKLVSLYFAWIAITYISEYISKSYQSVFFVKKYNCGEIQIAVSRQPEK